MNTTERDLIIAGSLASLAANMQHVRDDLTDIKAALPQLDDRITKLETESTVRKARESLILWAGGVLASSAGAIGMWVLTHLVG